MYLKFKKYKEHPNRVYLQLVESIREGKRVRKKTVLSLGRFDNGDSVNRINKLMKALLPHATVVQNLDYKNDIAPLRTKSYGCLLYTSPSPRD